MSFLADLHRELDRSGIRGRLARRIEAELADHLACDPQARLGTPAEIAERFAAELRIVRTRRATMGSFAALALCGGLFVVAVTAVGPAGGYRAAQQSIAASLSGLGMVAFAQIAFVAGVLALARGLRATAPGDLRVAQRRAAVALAAGACVSISLAVHGAVLAPMPGWWRALTLACALVPLPALAAAAVSARSAATLTAGAGPAPGLAADLPGPLARRPATALAVLGLAAVALVVLQGVVGEHSLGEGLLRGAIEAAGLAAAVLLLGRVLALRR